MLEILLPVVAGAASPLAMLGLYIKLERKSRELLLDRHDAALERRDAQLAAKDFEIHALTLQLQTLEHRLKFSAELLAASSEAGKYRADPALPNQSYELVPLPQASRFFNRIARLYNDRNTGKYNITYSRIYEGVANYCASLEGLRVCDVGGGTGLLLRRFRHHNVAWLNVDFSSEIQKVFCEEFGSTPHVQHRTLDVDTDKFIKSGEKFDVIVMSFLLSCMPRTPDLSQIRNAMSAQSILVVADNHFHYVRENPKYAFEIDGVNLAIQPRPMIPHEVAGLFESEGFLRVGFDTVEFDGQPYSQLHFFRVP